MDSFRRITYPPSRVPIWEEYELKTLEEHSRFMAKMILGIAIFGSVVMDLWTVYLVNYLIDKASSYPDNRIWILIGISIILAVVINGLTAFLGYRVKEGNETP